MNLVETLAKEMAGKDFTLEEKARYIYIRCAQEFTYDPRYFFCDKIKNGDELKKQILNKRFDIENITDRWVVCAPNTKDIYNPLLKRLSQIQPKTIELDEHFWSQFNIHGIPMMADATIKALEKTSDLTRAKMNLETSKYYPKNILSPSDYHDELKAIDKKIGYIQEDYKNTEIENLKKQLNQQTRRCIRREDALLYKWNKVIEELQKYQNSPFPINLQTCMGYLILHLLEKDDQNRIQTVKLFQPTNGEDWFFLNLYIVTLGNSKLYYAQPRQYNQFQFFQVSEQDAIHYMNCLRFADNVQEEEWKNHKRLVK